MEENFAAMFEASESIEKKKARVGDVLAGSIVLIDKEYAFIDYGGKGEAMIAVDELLNEEGQMSVDVGDSIEASVVAIQDGSPLLSKTLRKAQQNKELLFNAYQSQLPVEGRVTGTNKGGFDVVIANQKAFCPISQIDMSFVEDQQQYVEQSYSFLITEYANNGKRLVVSRRKLQEQERQILAEDTRQKLEIGMVFEGVVSRIQPFGVFVDIGGLDGLVHVSELSHNRIDDPGTLVSVGDKIQVQVKEIQQDKKGKERIALSMKALAPDPWTDFVGKYHEGDILEGIVVRMEKYGAFVQLVPGVDGLVHVSQISYKRISHPQEVLQEGQRLAVKILEIDWDSKRIALSHKEADGNEAQTQQATGMPASGTVVSGTVEQVKPFGLIIRLHNEWRDVTGLLPMEESGANGLNELKKKFPIDSSLDVAVESVDQEKNRIRFSLNQLEQLKAQQEYQEYQDKSSTGSSLGTFGDLLKGKLSK